MNKIAKRSLALLPAIALASSCVSTSATGRAAERIGDNAPPELQGYWRSLAPGWILEIEPEITTLDDATRISCASSDSAPLSEFYERYRPITPNRTAFFETGKTTFESFEKIDRPPSTCSQSLASTPRTNFDAFATIFEEQYPFFAIHSIDWKSRVAATRKLVLSLTSDEELYEILTGMLSGLDDGHVQLHATINGVPRVSRTDA